MTQPVIRRVLGWIRVRGAVVRRCITTPSVTLAMLISGAGVAHPTTAHAAYLHHPAPEPRTASPVSRVLSNPEAAYLYFRHRGLANFQAAGIVGNLLQESTPQLDPAIAQFGDGPGRGIAQWTVDDRWVGCVALAASEGVSPFTLGVQLDYIWQEMTSTYDLALSDVLATGNVGDATAAFEQDYEAAGDPQMDQRVAYATQILADYGNE